MWRRVKRELLRVGGVTLWSFGAAAFNFVAGIVLARSLGPAGRGLISVLVSVAGLASVAAALGTNVAFRALLPGRSGVNLRGFIKVTLLLLAMSGLPLVLLASAFVALVVDSKAMELRVVVLFAIFGLTNLLWLQAKDALNAVGLIGTGAAVGAVGSLIFACTVICVAVLWPGNYLGVMAAYCFMNLCQVTFAASKLRPHWGTDGALGARRILGAGPPYLAYQFGQELTLRLDRTLIGVFANNSAVGLFAVGAGMAEMLRLPVLASGQFVLHESASVGMTIRSMVRRAGLWMCIVMGGAALIWPLAPLLIVTIYGPEYAGAVAPFRILLIAQVMLVPFLIVSRALVGLGGRWIASVPSLVGLLVLVVASVFWIPLWQAVGGALACLLAFAIMSIVAWACVKRLLHVRHDED